MSKIKSGPRVPYTRKRRNNGIATVVNTAARTVKFGSTAGTYVTTYSTPGSNQVGTLEECTDVVTPGFSRLISEGRVINNPFVKVSATLTYGGTGPALAWRKATSPWPTGNISSYDAAFFFRGGSAMKVVPPVDEFGNLYLPTVSMIDLPGLVQQASTGALAKVDQSSAQGVTSLGELKATLALLANPLAAVSVGVTKHLSILNSTASRHQNLNKLISRSAMRNVGSTAPDARQLMSHVALTQRLVALRKQNNLSRYGRNVLRSLSDQYLAMYYGLKPLLAEIESILQAYIDEGHTHERTTARSGAEKSAFRTDSTTNLPNPTWISGTILKTTKEEVSVRKGILYTPTESSYQRALGFRFGDLPAGVYDLVPWSFMFDYFSNLGKLVRALSPRFGVEYLASWLVTKTRVTTRYETIASSCHDNWNLTRPGTEWYELLHEATTRTPISPYNSIGFETRVSNFGIAKTGAMIALITQALVNSQTLKG